MPAGLDPWGFVTTMALLLDDLILLELLAEGAAVNAQATGGLRLVVGTMIHDRGE